MFYRTLVDDVDGEGSICCFSRKTDRDRVVKSDNKQTGPVCGPGGKDIRTGSSLVQVGVLSENLPPSASYPQKARKGRKHGYNVTTTNIVILENVQVVSVVVRLPIHEHAECRLKMQLGGRLTDISGPHPQPVLVLVHVVVFVKDPCSFASNPQTRKPASREGWM